MLYQNSSLYPDQRYPQSNEPGGNRFLQGSIQVFPVDWSDRNQRKNNYHLFYEKYSGYILRKNPQLCGAPKSAVLSTVEVDTGIKHHEAHLTTPESLDLQRYFAQTRDSGISFLTMEVSSQAYKLNRVYGVEYDLGMFLNIGEDHIGPLEHTDFEDYFSCKLQFMEHCKTAVINRDMDHAQRVLERARAHAKRVITFGRLDGADLDDEDCWILRDIQKRMLDLPLLPATECSRTLGVSAWREDSM